jgi:putative MATE family efflux protein
MQTRADLKSKILGLGGIRFMDGAPAAGELYRRNMAIAWPATLEGALLSLISAADTMMVGVLGPSAIAAVGLTAQPRMILLILAQSLCVGTTAVIARRKGADDRQSAIECLKQSLAIVIGLGIIMSLAGTLGAVPFMRLAGANEETLGMAVDYFRVISSGLIFNCVLLCICAAMRAIGKTRVTMLTNITANLVNLALNYLLIGGNFGFPRLGVKGAAIATVIGTGIACVIAVYFVMREDSYLRFKVFEKIRMGGQTLKSLLNVGMASVAESAFLRIGFLLTARMIAGIGTAAFAAYMIVMQVTTFSFTLGDGIATAGATLVGQSLGACRPDLARANAAISRRLSIAVSLAMMTLLAMARNVIPLAFTNDSEIIAGVSLAFLVVILGILPQNGRVVYSGCLRGAGDARYVAACSLLSVTIIRPLLTYGFCYPANAAFPALRLAVTGPWLAFVLDALIRDGLYIRRIKQEKWLCVRL